MTGFALFYTQSPPPPQHGEMAGITWGEFEGLVSRVLCCVIRRLCMAAFTALPAVCAPVIPASAQTFPEKPVTPVVPLASGGGLDMSGYIRTERDKWHKVTEMAGVAGSQ